MSHIKQKLKENYFTKGIYEIIRRSYFSLNSFFYNLMSNETFAQKKYMKKIGKKLDLKNPQTFDEKLWWIKFNYHNPLITMCSDKYWAREYVRLCGYEDILIDLYGVYDKFEDIDFDNLPDTFFIKTNHDSGHNIIYDKSKPFDFKKNKKLFNRALRHNFYYNNREWGYKNVEPKIICEKVLKDPQNNTLNDFKIFCINGKVKYVTVNLSSSHEDGSHCDTVQKNVYDKKFNYIPVRFSDDNFDPKLVKKPKNLEKMIEIAEKLAAPFPEVRVDLYNVDGKIYFGELTFYHNGSYNDSDPENFLIEMGQEIKIPQHFLKETRKKL